MAIEPEIGAEAERWHHHPGPVRNNPLFSWPPQPVAVLRWYAAYWLAVSTITITAVFSVAVYFTLLPALETMQTFQAGWMVRVWLANLLPQAICAGGLHMWLYHWHKQGNQTKYDARDLARDNGTYTFGNQVWDNMFWTLVSGVTLWTVAQWVVFWMMANGYAPAMLFPDNPVWFVLMFPFLVIWSSFHFYWVHRLLHVPAIYKHAHALHHRNVNVGPWSGISMHPLEHLLFYTNFAIHLIVPSHPIHILFHGYVQSVHPVFSHSGFDQLVVRDEEKAKMGDFFHQLHHRYFECNYGTVEMPWDKWFGSFHNGSAEATQRTRAFKKQMYTK
ncbi:sterol desaturase family protein [Sulfitobacter mediterraneus]|uniref:sterol desaturase family protein n=1 Tax=Sulfitobacter mediterraneus TaxID=83219 RepID=UPI001934402C|nr:sterol desaturase family protein [Sulfitobacter mediterraneus]MBM1310330.1 sterol desaturase family protein [Sulfitobacter mediterraneus]MBM1314214.1 sterol desaturase family protein [Sulfitobacter mediterraneus]MBM1322574.1 sterol desaturase family protein [Sulfitobacter mediterraneus]MBM1326486.1 sterol desaturase family protein [Sulfitobacter mediterraneus]MBM1397832.1 sterol desaturase family protein [Sulfitobacter mediterraneus]